MERARDRQSVHQRAQRRYRTAARVSSDRDTVEVSATTMGGATADEHEGGRDSACYRIEGGIPLVGEVRNSGAKNAATKLMVAALLTEDRCTLRNMPAGLGDVTITEEVLRSLGAEVSWPEDGVASVRAVSLDNTVVPLALGRKNRLAVLTTGPLLHRAGHAVIPAPGGRTASSTMSA